MKRLVYTALTLLTLVLLTWGVISLLFMKKVDPGNVGIIVNYAEGHPSASTVPTGTFTFINPFAGQTFIEYPTAQQSLTMTANQKEGEVQGDDSVQCQDSSGIGVRIDVTVVWQVDPQNVLKLYLLKPNMSLTGTFNGDIESTLVRRSAINATSVACSLYTWDSLNTHKLDMDSQITSTLRSELTTEGIIVSQVYVGEVHYNSQQTTSLNQVAQAQLQAQQAQYLKQKADYEAQATIAKAQGDAQAIAILNKELANSPSYIAYLIATKWDGHLPNTVVGTNNPIIKALS